ncbi:MAG: hypothetical protein AAB426_09115 [Myxococcota bacterium]
MRVVKKALLWVVSTAIPVTIAACYGVAYRFSHSQSGRVLDAATSNGIAGIEVTCLVADGEQSTTYSREDGAFELPYEEPCDSVRAADVDGAENGGTYATETVPFDENADELVIELDAQP